MLDEFKVLDIDDKIDDNDNFILLIIFLFICLTGALFEPNVKGQLKAFESAVQSWNLMPDVLDQFIILDDDDEIQPHDSFGAQRKGEFQC